MLRSCPYFSLVTMDQNLENYGLGAKAIGRKLKKSNKCNQCEYASSRADSLRTHVKIHSGEKSNKCNQCDYASSDVGHLKRHLKTHSGEKPNKSNHCDYASSEAGDLRRHLKTHSGKKNPKNATSVTIHLFGQND